MEDLKNNKQIPNFLEHVPIENHKSNNSPKHICFKCGKRFKSFDGLSKHLIKLKHGRQCAICNYRTTSTLKFHCHNANEHQSKLHGILKKFGIKCSQCSYFVESSNALKDHVSKAHISKSVEMLNKYDRIKKFNRNNTAKINRSENKLNDDEINSFESLATKRIKPFNKEPNQVPKISTISPVLKCFKCSKGFKSFEGLRKHFIKYKHGRQCALCNYQTESPLNFHCHNANKHQMKLDKKWELSFLKCPECSYYFENSTELNDHVCKPTETLKKYSDSQNYIQSNRNNTAKNNSSETELINDKITSLVSPLSTELEILKNNKKIPDCLVNFPIENRLRKKSNISPKCFKCKKSFKSFNYLRKHLVQFKHGRQCEICNYRTGSILNFHCHNANVHHIRLRKRLKESILKCKQCSYFFENSNALKDHVYMTHSISRRSVEILNENADVQNNLQSNGNNTLNINSKNESIPLSGEMVNCNKNGHNNTPELITQKCHKCEKNFGSFKQLNKHLAKLRHGRQCAICNYHTDSTITYHCHNANEHQIELPKIWDQSVIKCSHCFYLFENSDTLRDHVCKAHISNPEILSKHSDIPNYIKPNGFNTDKNNNFENAFSSTFSAKKETLKKQIPDYLANLHIEKCKTANNLKFISPKHMCFKCKKCFKSFEGLSIHLIKFNHGRQCSLCNYRTSSTLDFHCHIKNVHQSKLHVKLKESVFKCSHCSYFAENSNALNDHVYKVHSIPRPVEILNENADIHNNLQSNINSTLNNTSKNASTPLMSEMENDKKKMHYTAEDFAVNYFNSELQKSNVSSKLIICFKCKKTFKAFEELKKHLGKWKHGQQCIICNYRTASTLNFHCHNADEHQIELHNRWEQIVLKCSQCSYFLFC